MSTQFYLGENRLSLNAGIPKGYSTLTLSGSDILFASEGWGTVIVQQLHRLHYCISLNILNCLRDIRLRTRVPGMGLVTTAVLKNDFQQIICGNGKIAIQQGHLVSAYGQAIEKILLLKKQKEIITLDIHYSLEMLTRIITKDFPQFNYLLQNDGRYPLIVGEPFRQLSEASIEVINNLLCTPYKEQLQNDYIDSLVEEHLYNVLTLSDKENDLSMVVTEGDRNKINKAINYILADLDTHHSINEIAEHIKMSSTILKLRFRQVTGKCIHDYLMYHRCLRIRDELINTNKPLKALFEQSGYRDVPAMINGFKRHVGCSPTDFRNRRSLK